MRDCLIERFPGMYVPAMPSKKKTGPTEEFLQDRCFHLNLFLKQLARIPYIMLSEEMKVFFKADSKVEKDLAKIPNWNVE